MTRWLVVLFPVVKEQVCRSRDGCWLEMETEIWESVELTSWKWTGEREQRERRRRCRMEPWNASI